MKNIMVINMAYRSQELESVCVLTETITIEIVKTKLDENPNIQYTDIFEVEDNDLQLYDDEPIHEKIFCKFLLYLLSLG